MANLSEKPAEQPHSDPGLSQTDWSVLRLANSGDASAERAWEQLARRYWPAIFAFVRSSGFDMHEAADLTQGFICDVVLRRGLVADADPARGRFRSLLLTALRNYIVERHRHAARAKRRPPTPIRTLDADGPIEAVEPGASPESAFAAQWSVSLVHRVLDVVRRGCLAEDLGPHWEIFDRRVVRPMLTGAAPTPYAELVDWLGLDDPAQAANMMVTVKRRFARALTAAVAETVTEDTAVEDELLELQRLLEGAS